MTAYDHRYDPAHAHPFARTDRSPLGVWWWTTDRMLLGAVTVLIALGVMLSFAASPSAAARLRIGPPFYFAIRQCAFGVGAVGILVGASVLSPRGIRRLAVAAYIVSIAIMAALPFLNHGGLKGADRWLSLVEHKGDRHAGHTLPLLALRKHPGR